MRNALVLSFLLLGAITLPAQQSTPDRSMETQGCPIHFGAQINSRAIAYTVSDQKKKGDTLLLEMTFVRRETPQIIGANITVHGLSSSGRYLPVQEPSGQKRTQTFELDWEAGATPSRQSEVWVDRVPVIRRAEITELRYADGSAWHPSSESQCNAVPSGFRLVSLAAQ